MSYKGKNNKSVKIKKVIKILTFLLTIDDLEMIKAAIESAIETLEEI